MYNTIQWFNPSTQYPVLITSAVLIPHHLFPQSLTISSLITISVFPIVKSMGVPYFILRCQLTFIFYCRWCCLRDFFSATKLFVEYMDSEKWGYISKPLWWPNMNSLTYCKVSYINFNLIGLTFKLLLKLFTKVNLLYGSFF